MKKLKNTYMMNHFTVLETFPSEEDFGTDPWGYRLLLNGNCIRKYGDDYHDKGHYKTQGFISGYSCAKRWEEEQDYVVEWIQVVDNGLSR